MIRPLRLSGSWLYANSIGLVAASYEDFGLTPVEAGAYGKPAAVLRWGGFLDTVQEGTTGVFFDEPTPEAIAAGIRALRATAWNARAIREVAARYGERAFARRLQAIAEEEATTRTTP